jgi:hypothetical protein
MRLERTLRDELIALANTVDREIAMLKHYKDVFDDFRSVILISPDQAALRFGHFFVDAMFIWYQNYQHIALRAITDRRADQLTLTGLLERIDVARAESFAIAPEKGDVRLVIRDLGKRRAKLHQYVAKRVAHRDADVMGVPNDSDFDNLLAYVDETMGTIWRWLEGENYERRVIDRDPYWGHHLFATPWLPPTDFAERLSLGSEIRFVPKSQCRDYTMTSVFARRVSDEELSDMGITRPEFERQREAGK